MSLARTLLNSHFKKAWTFTNACQLRVMNPRTTDSQAGFANVGTVIAVNTSAKFKLNPTEPNTFVVKLTVEHGVDQQRIYALDPTLYLVEGHDTHKELKEGYKVAVNIAVTETAAKRWTKWVGTHATNSRVLNHDLSHPPTCSVVANDHRGGCGTTDKREGRQARHIRQ